MSKIILPPIFLTYSLGCRTNQAETTRLEEQLINLGFIPFPHVFPYQHKGTSLNNPCLVLINTCVVTSKAEKESRGAIRHFKKLYPKAKVVALGCAANFVNKADLIIENKDKNAALPIIKKTWPRLFPKKFVNPQSLNPKIDNLFARSGRALVKIQEGCDQFCAYCLVPFLRGKPKSLPVQEIICQINKLTDQEIKEIILCGINLSLYGKDLKPSVSLTYLIKKILSQTKAERICLSSIEPEYLYRNKQFTDLFINQPRLSKYFHLALQSGSAKTIKNMGRETDLEKLLKSLQLVKKRFPEFTFRADVIVGFPTETEKDFQATLNFIRKAPIVFCHVFPYSIRPETLAEKLIKNKLWRDLSGKIKKERVKKTIMLTKEIQKEEGKRLIGKILPCLIINNRRAVTNHSWPIKITTGKGLMGKIYSIKIKKFSEEFLKGKVIH